MERPVLRYHGGKWLLAPWIISHFPEHKVYVEPYGGAASVLMRKPRSYAEVYNDLDDEVVNLFRILQNKNSCHVLERLLSLTPFARSEFNIAYQDSDDPIEQARRLIIRSFMGFGSDGHNKLNGRTGFRSNSNRSGTTPAHDWANYAHAIPWFLERLSGVVIENRDALEVMGQQDSTETLHFIDPPYVLSTRHDKAYKYEMTDEDHLKLCNFLATLKGMVILCGYRNPIYDTLGWRSIEREALADGAKIRTEVLWFNQHAINRQIQVEMF